MKRVHRDLGQVSGAALRHGVEEFQSGETVVLTIADKPLLAEEGNSYTLDSSEQLLENVNMVRGGMFKRLPIFLSET